MTLSTHVLDTARGMPAAGIAVALYALEGDARRLIAQAETNDDGRTVPALGADLGAGTYELVFSVGEYFERSATPAFYDEIAIRVRLSAGDRYHVPLILTPWSYATYRGS
jgi:5-hydroxyisourate hydrolase